jgi:hypothetical protein
MKQKSVTGGGLVIDFLVPASLASRYWARLTALSPAEAELSLSFCPSIFRSGARTCCPAEISAVFGASAVRVRGSFHLEGGSSCTTARFRFDPSITLRDLELLQQASLASCVDRRWIAANGSDSVTNASSPDEAEPVSAPDSATDGALDACPRESESAWFQSTTTH